MNPRTLILAFFFIAAAGCSDSPPAADPHQIESYFGLDSSIIQAIDIGFAGMRATSTANIPMWPTNGRAHGQLVVQGQVDQGASSRTTLRLDTAYSAYSDDGTVIYDTMPEAPPLLALTLRGGQYGTLHGTFEGVFNMSGALHGSLTLLLTLDGQLQPDGTMWAARVPYSTQIIGTAVSDYGTYQVDVTR